MLISHFSVAKRRKRKPSSVVELKVVIKLNCVGGQIVTAERAIASVSICGAFVTIAVKKQSTELSVRLSDISMLDMSPRSHFKKVRKTGTSFFSEVQPILLAF